VHFVGLVNVLNVKAGGLATSARSSSPGSRRTSRTARTRRRWFFAHVPLWVIYPEWGWGTDDGERVLALLKRFGSVTVLNGHVHQIIQKVEGNVAFHTVRSTAFEQPEPGSLPAPVPIKVDDDKLRTVLGITSINPVPGQQRLAIVDTPLQA
jgi:3',5'-cyclic-AMP phosphodiesterase